MRAVSFVLLPFLVSALMCPASASSLVNLQPAPWTLPSADSAWSNAALRGASALKSYCRVTLPSMLSNTSPPLITAPSTLISYDSWSIPGVCYGKMNANISSSSTSTANWSTGANVTNDAVNIFFISFSSKGMNAVIQCFIFSNTVFIQAIRRCTLLEMLMASFSSLLIRLIPLCLSGSARSARVALRAFRPHGTTPSRTQSRS